MKIHPYLNYGGNCEEAFRFYEQHLGGKIVAMMPHGSMLPPGSPEGLASPWARASVEARGVERRDAAARESRAATA